jgi:putative transposase
MNPAESLKYTKWECKYHVVWIPKYRKKSLYQGLRRYLGDIVKSGVQGSESSGDLS